MIFPILTDHVPFVDIIPCRQSPETINHYCYIVYKDVVVIQRLHQLRTEAKLHEAIQTLIGTVSISRLRAKPAHTYSGQQYTQFGKVCCHAVHV